MIKQINDWMKFKTKYMSNDKKTISKQPREIRQAAETMNVPEWFIHLAKNQTKSNDRETVYKWIEKNKETLLFNLLVEINDAKGFDDSKSNIPFA